MNFKKYKYLVGLGLISFLLSWQQNAFTQEKKTYFYHKYDFGSEAIFNPVTIILNGGYGIFQLGNNNRKLLSVDYRRGWQNVWQNISHPFEAINSFGWKNFIRTEIMPTTMVPRSSQYWPNYQNHLIGGGMTFRAFREWFDLHDYPHSGWLAFSAVMIYHTLNEVVENNTYRGVNVDPIADMLIFNPLGILLFSSDAVAGFFGEKLQLRDWSFFPAINPYEKTIENNGQNFAIKIRLSQRSPWSLFYSFGLNGILGLSYRWPSGKSVSFGGGLLARGLRSVDRDDEIRAQTVDLVWNVGIFYDKQGSLMASLLLSGNRTYKMRATFYPGLVKFFKLSPGLFAALGEKNDLIFGIHFPAFPIGLAGKVGL